MASPGIEFSVRFYIYRAPETVVVAVVASGEVEFVVLEILKKMGRVP